MLAYETYLLYGSEFSRKNGAHCGNVGGDYCAYGNDYVSGEIREVLSK